MEKGSFRRYLREGADNLPNPEALGRALKSWAGRKEVRHVGLITLLTAASGGSLYATSQLFTQPERPQVASNPIPKNGITPPEVTTAIAEAVNSALDNNGLRNEGIDPFHPDTFMNYGIASCRTGTAYERSFWEDLNPLSPAVAEAAPLEVKTRAQFLKCIQDIEKVRPFWARFGINVQKWDDKNIIGVNTIAFWRQQLAGELRKRGFDMTPEEMGSFIGNFIPTTFRDSKTGEVKIFTANVLDSKAEVDRRKAAGDRSVHWSGELMWIGFDPDTAQVGGVMDDDTGAPCDNEILPFQLRKAERATPVPLTVTASPTKSPTPTAAPKGPILKVRKLADDDGDGIFIGKDKWQFRIRSVDDPDCKVDEFHSTNSIGELFFPISTTCLRDGKVRMEVDEDVDQLAKLGIGPSYKAVRKSAFQFADFVEGVSVEELEFFNVPLREVEQPGQPEVKPAPTPTPTPAQREATATPQPTPQATQTPRPEATPTPTIPPTPTPTPAQREATATPQPTPQATPTREATATPQTNPQITPTREAVVTPGSTPQAAPSKEPSRTPSQPTAGAATPSAASPNPTRESIATPTRR